MNQNEKTLPIVVVGAGVAGIACAVELTRRGKRVCVLEEKPYLGGRARSFLDSSTGSEIDNGQHVMMGCYHSFRRLLRILGTEHHLKGKDSLAVDFVDSNGGKSTLNTSYLPGKLGIAFGIFRLQHIAFSSRIRAVILAARLRCISQESIRGKNVREFLDAQNQPSDIIQRFWEPITLATLNSTIDIASAELFTVVLKRAFFSAKEDARLLIANCGLSQLLSPSINFLRQTDGSLLTSHSVSQVSDLGDRVVVSSRNGVDIEASAVVLALSPRVLERVSGVDRFLTPEQLTSLAEFSYSPITSVYLWLDKEIFEGDFVCLLGTTIQWIFNRTRLTKEVSAKVFEYGLTVSASDSILSLDREDLLKLCLTELTSTFPECHSATVLHSQIIKETFATFRPTVGIEKFRLTTATNSPRIFLAGDATATGLPATLEGAALSGFAAADMLFDDEVD